MAGKHSTSDPDRNKQGRPAGRGRKILALALAVFFLAACAGPVIKKDERPRGVYHRVKKGETLWAISRAYRTDLQDIAEINNITNPAAIEEDSIVFIPGADQVVDVPPLAAAKSAPRAEVVTPIRKPAKPPVKATRKKPLTGEAASVPKEPPTDKASTMPRKPPADVPAPPAPAKQEEGKLVFDRSRFIWPMRGSLAARFGIQVNGLKHNGIWISGREGTPIVASAAGEVIHAAPIKYYGETIIIKHDGHYSTVYTFLKHKRVKVGDRVKKGERIALLSRPENGNGKPYLNFEIRQNNKPRNPLFFLPERGAGSP